MNKHGSMNRVYRLIWNEALGAFVPASELSRARGKRSSRVLRSTVCAALALVACEAVAADPAPNALPSGGQVIQGAAALNESAGQLDITQSTDRVVIDWQRFDIGSDAAVNFLQPSSSSIALNRVLSSDPSAIFGRLTANGQVFLSNPNGVLFGSSARVDVGGLVATSMRIDLADFASGLYRFAQGRGPVTNEGVIHAADGGYLALMAPEVRNEGVLSARLGTIALAAGEAVTLQLGSGAPLAVQVDPATIDVLLENRHLIQADGGQVILSASAAERLIDAAIAGASGATALVAENGTVRLVDVEGTIRASGITIDGGAVGVTRVAGELDASSAANGGAILVSGDKVMIDAGASLDASGRDGGTVLIGGDRQGANPEVRNAARVFIDADASVRADGGNGEDQSGDAGRVIVYSTLGAQVYGTLSARGGAAGGNGGFIETSGGWLDIASVPDASAAAGQGGEWLIDPYNITIQAAGSNTSIGSSPNWTSSANSAILTTGSLQSALNAGTSVTVTTGAGGAQGGDITVASAIVKSAGGDASLTLNAHRDIVIDAPITSTSGALSLVLNADTDSDFAGAIVLNDNLTTLGGAISFMDGLVIGGSSAVAINTAGGAGGNVNFNAQALIGNTSGVSITTGGGNVTFSSLLDSGNGYTFVNDSLTWSSARSAAASGTGANIGDTYLAAITSPLEMSRAAATAGYSQSWLGGSDTAVEGTWRWVTGPEGLEDGGQGRIISIGNRSGMGALTGYNGYSGGYVNWNASEPNDAGGEDALQLGFGAAGQWNDLPTGSSTLPYVRETNLAASPLTIDSGAGNITFNGEVGANKEIGQLTLSGSGGIFLNTNTVNVSGNLDINAGGNLVLGAVNSPTLFADDGSIFISRAIVKNAGADASLTLRADNDIIIDSSADVAATSNRLNLTINSNRDASVDGGIYIGSGSMISSNGGNIVLGGGATPASTATVGSAATSRRGIFLVGAQINAGSGNVTLNGRGENNGIPDAGPGIGVDLVQSTIETSSGSIALTGVGSTGNNIASLGISVFDGSLVRSTAGGNIALTGSATASGDFAAGINLELNGAVAALNGGNVTLTGTGSASGTSGGSGWRNHGVYLQNSGSVLATGGGAISLTGTAGAGSSGIATLNGANVIGNSAGYSGNITLTADTMALANLNVRSSGALTVRPLTPSTSIGLGDSAAGTLNLSAAELASIQDGFSALTFGRSDGTGDVDGRDYIFTDAVTLISGAGDGDITVNGHLQNTGGSISIESGDSIQVSASGDVTSQGGTITLNSDRDGSGAGNIALASGAAVTSNGGNITLRGGSAALTAVGDPTAASAAFAATLNATGARGSSSHGIDLSDATLAAGGGNIELRGVGADGYDGVHIAAGSALTTTANGSIAIHGLGGAGGSDSDGVHITQSGSSLATQSGELRVQGLGRGTSSSQGIDLETFGDGATSSSVDGNIVLRGASTGTGTLDQGVLIQSASFLRTSGAGSIDIVGRGGGASAGVGVHLFDNAEVQTTGGGDIAMTGYGSASGALANNEGVKIDASLVEVQAGANADLTVLGYGGTGTDYNIGVNTRLGGTLRMGASATGEMTVTGTGGGNASGTGNWGVLAEGDGIYESLGSAAIRITGIGGAGSDNHGIRVTGGSANRIGSSSMTGGITLRADTMDLQGSGTIVVRSTGNLAIEPYSANTTIGLGNGATGTLSLNATELSRLADGFAQITIGRIDGTGAMDVETAAFTDHLRLLNTGAGSGGIDFDGAADVGANRLWLSSSGPVTQSAAISANQLLLSGAGAFALDHAANAVNTLAGSVGGNLSFNDSGSFVVGSITATGLTFDGVASSGGSVVLRASGATSDLTLQQGVTAAGTGTTLQLIAGRNFVNSFGAAALDAGAGRWLVWSADPATATRGGLAYDFKQYAATYGVTSPAQSSGGGFLYSITPAITPVLTGAVSRLYDGTTAATLAGANFSQTGAIDGDTITLTTPTSGTFDTKDVGTAKDVSASSIAIASTTNGAAAVYGYQLASSNATGAIGEITPRTVTAALVGSTTKVYDGNDAATLASANYTLSGVLGGETVLLNDPTSGLYGSATAGGGKLVSVGGLAISGTDASNYALGSSSIAANIGTITPRALVVTADDAGQSYGDANPVFTASYDGFASAEDASVLAGALSFDTAGNSASSIGTYAITTSGLSATNYTLSYLPGTLTIDPAALTVTADDLSKIYGDVDPSLTYVIGGAGLRNGDLLSGSLFAPGGAAATAGLHQIQQGDLAASSNYLLTFVPGTLSVARAPLLITAHDQIKTYGDADPSLTYTIGGSGLRYGDVLSGALSAPAGSAANAGTHAIAQGTVAASSNYALMFAPGTLTVLQAPLIITADDQSRFLFADNPPLTASASGWRYGEDFSVVSGLQLGTSATRSSLPGTYAIDAGNASAANYAITFVQGALGVLAQSSLSEIPRAGNAANNASAASAPEQAAIALSSTAPGMHSTIRNGGIAVEGGLGPSMATTMSSGFLAVEPLAAIDVDADSQVAFTLPAGTFRHTDTDATVMIDARSADGSPLPAWLNYDPQSGVLSGTAPANEDELTVVFVARDAMGGEATTTLELHLRK